MIALKHKNADDAIRIKNILIKHHGLVENKDFYWKYVPPVYDNFAFHSEPAQMEIYFVDAAQATFFQLKLQ